MNYGCDETIGLEKGKSREKTDPHLDVLCEKCEDLGHKCSAHGRKRRKSKKAQLRNDDNNNNINNPLLSNGDATDRGNSNFTNANNSDAFVTLVNDNMSASRGAVAKKPNRRNKRRSSKSATGKAVDPYPTDNVASNAIDELCVMIATTL